MKDIHENEYVRPTACSHIGCPPWQCVLVNPELPEPISPAQERQVELDRRSDYQNMSQQFRKSAMSAPTPELRERMERMASDNELMAQGRVTETASWKESRQRDRALEGWREEVQKANSSRLIADALVGFILGVAFLVGSYEETSNDRIHWVVSSVFICLLATFSCKFLLNLLFGLPKKPTP